MHVCLCRLLFVFPAAGKAHLESRDQQDPRVSSAVYSRNKK
jgi:hypothetical protein